MEGSRWRRRVARDADQGLPSSSSSTSVTKPIPPVILGLAAPVRTSASQQQDHDMGSSQQQAQSQNDSGSSSSRSDGGQPSVMQPRSTVEKPIVVLKSRDDNRSSSVSPGPSAAPVSAPMDSSVSSHMPPPVPAPHALYPPAQQRHCSTSHHSLETGKNRLNAPPEMKRSVKIIDENFRWIEDGVDDLVDQTDYLVVGVLGLQGSGKSTIMSLLGGNSAQDPYRSYIFQPEVRETREDAFHQTMGVDMFVSPERIIFLDTQPALSASVLDNHIQQEKKFTQEYTSTENCVEMQSVQIASFLMTVCHVILVVQDWFTDLTFLRSLLTAEMLRPQMHTSSHEGAQSNTHHDKNVEFYPTIVFIQNKASQDDFTPETYTDFKLTLQHIFRSSKLHYKGSVNMHKDGAITALRAKDECGHSDVNLFLLPTMEYYKSEPDSILKSLPEFRGFPSFAFVLRSLRNQLYSIPRMPMTNTLSDTPLSERNWFHFAARTWEAVKKSQLIAEYNRLLP